jgi:hypothetical protein
MRFIFSFASSRQWELKGELEKHSTPKVLPNPVGLFNTIPVQDGKNLLCELGLEN